jgi:hypothetical protein
MTHDELRRRRSVDAGEAFSGETPLDDLDGEA